MQNPFITGEVVPPEKFVGRRNEIRRLSSNIMKGSSSIVVGDPRVGKTSLLKYLSAPQKAEYLYGEKALKQYFQYFNAHTFNDDFDEAQFWQQAIEPLYKKIVALKPDNCSSIESAYMKCTQTKFSHYPSLENLFEKLDTSGWRLVLLVDEFDVVLEHPKLNNKGFLGNLRTLACHSSLAYIAAARQSLLQIEAKTKGYADGSPYFNILNLFTLGPIRDEDCMELLEWAGERFTVEDRRYLIELTGRYPYLLQVAASELWEAYIELPGKTDERYRQVERKLYDVVAKMFNDMWKLWSPEMRIAFIGAGLPDMALNNLKLRKHNLISEIKNMSAELRELQTRGLISEDPKRNSKWRVCSSISLWWLADQIVREVRDEASCQKWLVNQKIEGLLTTSEQKKWADILSSVGEVLKDGAKTLVEATAKGFAEAMIK